MRKCSSKEELDKIRNCVLIYVYNRIVENVIEDMVVINEVFWSNYFVLTKRISSSSLDIFLHFHSTEQVFKDIKKYFEITDGIQHRWLDVIKAAMEVDISLSIEEQLLSEMSVEQTGDSVHASGESTRKGQHNEVECYSLQAESVKVFDKLFHEETADNVSENVVALHESISFSNTEVVVQKSEPSHSNSRKKSTIRNITSWNSSSLVDTKSLQQTINSDRTKTYLFISSQSVLRSTHSISTPLDQLTHENIDELIPVFLHPFIQSLDSTLIRLGLPKESKDLNEQYRRSENKEVSCSVVSTICDYTYINIYNNEIKFLLPTHNFSQPQGVINGVVNEQTKQATVFNQQICVDKTEYRNILSKIVSVNAKNRKLELDCESIQDVVLCTANKNKSVMDSFISEQEVRNALDNLISIPNFNFICCHDFASSISSDCSPLVFSRSLVPDYFNQTEFVRNDFSDHLELISEYHVSGCNISQCSNIPTSEIDIKYLIVEKPKDIGYLSFFRSFNVATQNEILKNRNLLPCSKGLRPFSSTVEKLHYNSLLLSSTNKVGSIYGIVNNLHQLINTENRELQSKISFPKQLVVNNCTKLDEPVAIHENNPSNQLNSIFLNYFLELCLVDLIRKCFLKIKFNQSWTLKPTQLKPNDDLPNFPGKKIDNLIQIIPSDKQSIDLFNSVKSKIPRRSCNNLERECIPNQAYQGIVKSDEQHSLLMYQRSPEISEEVRCLNLVIYFLEELFDIWVEEMINMDDVTNILCRLFDQLKIILKSISIKKSIDRLTEVSNDLIDDIDASLHCSFDPVCVLLFLRSILHKINLFGKHISFHHIIPTSVKYSLYKLYMHYKTVFKNQKQMKLSTCLIEISTQPEVVNALFYCQGSDRRIRVIEHKAKCCIVLQPAKDPHEEKRLIKVYYLSHGPTPNMSGLISLITKAINKSHNKIQLSPSQLHSKSWDVFPKDSSNNLGDVKWTNFKCI